MSVHQMSSRKKNPICPSLSDAELALGWLTEGSTTISKGRVKVLEYSSQSDKEMVEFWCEELRRRHFRCKFEERPKGFYRARVDCLPDIFAFHSRFLEPYKLKMPQTKRERHEEVMRILLPKRAIPFGRVIRERLR